MCFSDIWALFAKRSGKSCVWRRVSGYRVFFLCFKPLVCFLAIQLTGLDVSGLLFWRKHTVKILKSLNINTLKQSTFSDVPFRVAYLFVYNHEWLFLVSWLFVIKQVEPCLNIFAPRSHYAVGLCLQDHSLPWSQSMVSFVWLCNWATRMPCSQLWQGTFYFPRCCKKFVRLLEVFFQIQLKMFSDYLHNQHFLTK